MIVQSEPKDPTLEEDTSEEEEGEIGISRYSQKKSKRGRKSDKEHKEEATYRDKLLGAQSTIDVMMNPISTRKKGHASKGASHLPNVK